MDESKALRGEQGWRTAGHSAKTLVKHQDLRIVLIAMKQGTRMETHQTGSSVSVHVLSGALRIHVEDRAFEISAGGLLALDRALAHDVEALEDSTCVLSMCANPSKLGAR